MAFIKKRGAKKELVRDVPMPSVKQVPASPECPTPCLRFNLSIDLFEVSLTEMERDIVISTWAKMAKLHQ